MIRIENLAKSYGPKTILRPFSYHFPKGERISLIGANGAGKSTLLNILCGKEEYDSGQILIPKGFELGYLPQIPNSKPKETIEEECMSGGGRIQTLKAALDKATDLLTTSYSEFVQGQFDIAEEAYRNAGGYSALSRARGILTGLGFHQDQFLQHPLTLSGGWRMRLELAKIFLNEPDFLILDEPTNHLDLPSLVWVEGFLQQYPGTLLFVSHDKPLLDRLANVTMHLHKGNLEVYKGNFSYFLEERELRQELLQNKAEKLQREKNEITRFVERFGAKATKARQAQSRLKRLAKLENEEDSLGSLDNSEDVMMFSPQCKNAGPKQICEISGVTIGFENKPLCKAIDLKIFRGQKIAIVGANGIGKSTLLKSLVGEIPLLQGKMTLSEGVELSYFAQEQSYVLNPQNTVLEELLTTSGEISEKQARSLLGALLFKSDDAFKKVNVLSGGEKNRVGLAKLLASPGNFLILDEPTNHLDMSACEVLTQGLQEYNGTILFVSHDREFIDAVCTHVFVMLPSNYSLTNKTGMQALLFEGNLSDVETLSARAGFPSLFQNSKPESKNSKNTMSSENFQSNSEGFSVEPKQAISGEEKRKQELEAKKIRQKLEKSLAQSEQKQIELNEKMIQLKQNLLDVSENDSSNYVKMQELERDFASVQTELIEQEELWMKISEQLHEGKI